MDRLLPIFPLNLVLLPTATQALHIFEPRYKEMIGECLTDNRPFGIVRAQQEGIANIGCTAEITEVVKRYDDGRLDILTRGRDRFEIVQVNDDRSFLQAEVIYFEDEPGETPSENVDRLLQLHSQILELTGSESTAGNSTAGDLSFQLAASLPVDLDFQQALLTARSEPVRVAALIQFYEAALPKLARSVQARKLAGGNGHVH